MSEPAESNAETVGEASGSTPAQGKRHNPAPPRLAPGWLKNLAIVTGIVGFVLFVALPFLPVSQTQSTLDWPQDGDLSSVNAPLISYSPESLSVSLPVQESIDALREDQSLLLSTLPEDSYNSAGRGFTIRSYDGGLDVVARGEVVLSLTPEDVAELPSDAVLEVSATEDATTAEIPGATNDEGDIIAGTIDQDVRPQLTGLYTELDSDSSARETLAAAGLSAHVEINSRFTSTPTLLKSAAMVLGLVLLVISLWCLHRLDTLDGRASRRWTPRGWWRIRPLDGIVGFVLVYWHIFGANTSDDGYLLTMARLSEHSGYMANYYRWFGVPESPFGSPYYDLLALMTHVSTASVWMRLPALLSGLVVWIIISREMLPRLGHGIDGRRVAHWTAAMVFLAFWLPFNNGTRPEPIIAMGVMLSWASFERALATSRLFPAAVGVILATLSLGAGPTGLMAVAALLASLSGLFRILFHRRSLLGAGEGAPRRATAQAIAAMVAPFLAAGTAILICVFGDQTLASVLEAVRVRSAKGPALEWYDEWTRYQSLFEQSVDGSFARRFAVFMLFCCLGVVIATILRHGRIPGAPKDPTRRLVFIIFGTMFFMMFTPTKWTHHFGVYAGIAGALAALAAVALSYMAQRSAKARMLSIGGFLMVFALALAGTNGWWYVSSYGVPWFDKTIQYHGLEASTVVLAVALVVLAVGVVQAFVSDIRTARAEELGNLKDLNRKRRLSNRRLQGLASAPVAVLSAAVVVFSMACFAKSAASQYPAYSVGLGNLRSLTGNTCGLADAVMIETNTNESFLTPADGTPLGESLSSENSYGFSPNGLPESISGESSETSPEGSSQLADSVASDSSSDSGASSETNSDSDTSTTGGTRSQEGVNGSRAQLPYDIDYRSVPVLGSWTDGAQYPASTTTTWYELPERSEDTPILVVSAAGRIQHHDINGVLQSGQSLRLEYGTMQEDGSVTDEGDVELLDAISSEAWRNLRLPLENLPDSANVVRIVAEDENLDPDQWLAFLPPRVPTLDTLNNVLGSEDPGLLDWAVPLQFPCQRTFDHYAGVAEIPQYRITPDTGGRSTLTPVQDFTGGGVMAAVGPVNTSYEMPTYLRDDWQRDWGTVERYQLRTNSVGEAPKEATIEHEEITRSGLWQPSRMNIDTD